MFTSHLLSLKDIVRSMSIYFFFFIDACFIYYTKKEKQNVANKVKFHIDVLPHRHHEQKKTDVKR